MPKYIKTRNIAKNIKLLNNSMRISSQMKRNLIRTKDAATKSHSTGQASPTEYATEKAQNTTDYTARNAAVNLIRSPQQAKNNWNRAKGHFQEVQDNLPSQRSYAAEQAQKAAVFAKDNAIILRTNAIKTKDEAQRAQMAVKDAKRNLKEIKHTGKQTLREIKQNPLISHDRILRNRKPPIVKSTPPAGNIPAGGVLAGNSPAISSPLKGDLAARGPKANKALAGIAKPDAATIKATTRATRKEAREIIKTAKKSIKTAEKSAKAAVKTAKHTARATQKAAKTTARSAQIAAKISRTTTKTAAKTAKTAVKAIAATARLALAALQGLFTALVAGGWVLLVIILFIALLGIFATSMFGIFLSGEPNENDQTINSVITEIDGEYTAAINSIIADNPHDLLDMSGARALWKQVLAIYAVKTTTDPQNSMDVATIDDIRSVLLRTVFWDMNNISHTVETVEVEEDVLGDDGLPTGDTETVSKTVLRISISHKTLAEIEEYYSFNAEQAALLHELLEQEYYPLWNELLYGITILGDGTLIEIAATQMGNIGGEPYWGWYGFEERVDWCACFVSWVAEQCGYIDAGIIPRFASCTAGVNWYISRDRWQDNSYTPAPGDIIFFDWEVDDMANHVGIVERVDGNIVYTIEGNTSDSVAQRSYDLGSDKIFGYGVAGN